MCFFKNSNAELEKLKADYAILEEHANALEVELMGLKPPELSDSPRAEIDGTSLYALLRAAAPNAEIHISDNKKYLCDIDDINAFLTHDLTNRIQYEVERFDCDDFAFRLLGQFKVPGWATLAIGLVWTDVHALNCTIDNNGDLWLIEPQSDSVESNLIPWQGNEIRLVIV